VRPRAPATLFVARPVAPLPARACTRARRPQAPARRWAQELFTVEASLGIAAAQRLAIDRASLAQFQRAPGLRSSFAGLDTFLGRDEALGFEDILGSASAPRPHAAEPDDCPLMPVLSVHDALEARVGLK
jgi:hypothetical protein